MCQSLLLFLSFLLVILPPIERRTLYSRLDRQSLTKQLAFYRLFPETEEGKKAYTQACLLLQNKKEVTLPPLPKSLLDSIVSAVATNPSENVATFSPEELEVIETLAAGFPNRLLKGNKLKDEAEILKLPPEEIDLARALLVSQGSDISRLEAIFDIMALHIRCRLKETASDLEKIDAITTFIFDEMGFRFPPKSASIPEIDKYTSLPSVVDARKGVCLGVSILYLTLSQRLGLPLEVITPPGHIFVRYEDGGNSLNIETTARGVYLPDKTYLNLEYRALQHRTLKEVVGMAHMNEASIHWQKGNYEKALTLYEKALPYMPGDPLLQELLGYIKLFLGNPVEAKAYFAEAELKPYSFAQDWLEGRCEPDAIKLLFQKGEKGRDALLTYRKEIEKVLEKWPHFHAGWFYLGSTSLELGRLKEALTSLEHYHSLDSAHPTVEYLLTALYLERGQYAESWRHQKLLASFFPTEPPDEIEELRVKLLEKSYRAD